MTEEVVTYESRMVKFKENWERALPTIKALLPSHVTPERIFSVAVTARQRNPGLLECSDVSILRGIIIGAQLGLDVSGVGGKAYLVPYYNNNTKQKEAQFQVGWRGLVELAMRTGKVVAVYGREVYEGEEFAYEDGMVQRLQHIPSIGGGDPGKIVGAWAVAVFGNGFRQIEVMNRWQIEQVKAASKAQGGPWTSHYGQMAIKTVIKRLCKKLPDSVEMQMALEMEDMAETGQPQPSFIELPELEANEPVTPAPTRTEAIKAEIKRGRGRPPKPRPLEGVPLATVPAPPVTTETDDLPDDADFEDTDEDPEDGDDDE